MSEETYQVAPEGDDDPAALEPIPKGGWRRTGRPLKSDEGPRSERLAARVTHATVARLRALQIEWECATFADLLEEIAWALDEDDEPEPAAEGPG